MYDLLGSGSSNLEWTCGQEREHWEEYLCCALSLEGSGRSSVETFPVDLINLSKEAQIGLFKASSSLSLWSMSS
jgi:hypothetical protein